MKITKLIITLAIILTVVGVVYSNKTEAGDFGSLAYKTASSTAYTVGPQLSTTVLTARSGRGCMVFTNNGTRDIYIHLGSEAATINNSILQTGSSTVVYAENFPWTGDVTVLGTVSSTTLIVTECKYNVY